jgi:hypothetical protein
VTRREHTNTAIHLTGPPGRGVARVSGHFVLERYAMLRDLEALRFAGASVELVPGMTVFAVDVKKTFRLGRDGWQEHTGRVATPELGPPPTIQRTAATVREVAGQAVRDFGAPAAVAAVFALAGMLEDR